MRQALKKKNPYLIVICFVWLVVIVFNSTSHAQTARDLYYQAETAYQKLRHDEKKQQYRSYWFDCIKKFQKVYEYDPSGSWAAAGLYMTGTLYWELYRHSYYRADKKEAEENFYRIINRYPHSHYSQKAKDFLNKIDAPKPETKTVAAQAAKLDEGAKRKFYKAQECYQSLLKNRSKQKYRDRWLSCIRKFESVYNHDPDGPWAAAGLYMSGMLYEGLSGYSFNSGDKQKAAAIYDQIIRDYPESRYKKRAEQRHYKITGQYHSDKVAESRSSAGPDVIAGAIGNASDSDQSSSQNHRTTIKGIRYWSNPDYTRVVVDATGRVDYGDPHLLDEDPSFNKPRRLYFDIYNSRLDKNLKKYIAIDDNLLSAVRAAQYTKESVRVVIDIKSFKNYKIFPLLEPSRIVVDVRGSGGKGQEENVRQSSSSRQDDKMSSGALAKQLALGVRRIVIDPGHGGKDPGAVGYLKNVYEKNVTLDIANRLAKKIRAELNCEVILTRNSDQSISLEERTAFANTKNADLFISIHANAHRNHRAYGIETYYLNLATDDESIRVAARENATSEKNISDLHSILSDLMQNAKVNESSRLAAYVQGSLYSHMQPKYSYIKNNGVKKAPFYVLLGAQMPAILIETSFISNQRECQRLNSAAYQNHLCDGIVKGIRKYIEETSPNTLSRR